LIFFMNVCSSRHKFRGRFLNVSNIYV